MGKTANKSGQSIPAHPTGGIPLKIHPGLAAIGSTPIDRYQKLREHIEFTGDPGEVTVHNGQIIGNADGYYIALQLDITPTLHEYGGPDPVIFIIEHATAHWHYDKGQRATAVVRLCRWRDTAGRPGKADADEFLSQDQLATLAKVSIRQIQMAKAVVRHSEPAPAAQTSVADRILEGAISLKSAYQAIQGKAASSAGTTSSQPTRCQLTERIAQLEAECRDAQARAQTAEARAARLEAQLLAAGLTPDPAGLRLAG